MINREAFPEFDLVVHEVVGELDDRELHESGEALYRREPVPLFSLWDLTRASVSQYSLGRLRAILPGLVSLAHGREGGRTAVVAPADLTFGIVRQYIALIDAAHLPFEHRVFRNKAEALSWLGLDADSLDTPAGAEESA